MRIAGEAIQLGDHQGGAVEPAQLKGALQLRAVRVTLAALDLDPLADQLPAAAVEEVIDRLALGIEAEPAIALTLGRDPQVRDELALGHGALVPVPWQTTFVDGHGTQLRTRQ